MFNGKTHYTLSFSIAMLNYQRVYPEIHLADFVVSRMQFQGFAKNAKSKCEMRSEMTLKPRETQSFLSTFADWCFGTCFIFPDTSIGNVIIPTDEHIFQRGRSTTNQ